MVNCDSGSTSVALGNLPTRQLPLPERLALAGIRAYQVVSGPVWQTLGGGCCRFYPSCSVYASEAIAQHGLLAGMQLGARRVLRCHPWGGQGFDPVPERVEQGRRSLAEKQE